MMKWQKMTDVTPPTDGAYMITDGEVSTFGTYSTVDKVWKPVVDSYISTVLWWKELPLLPRMKVCGDIDDMGKYLYDDI